MADPRTTDESAVGAGQLEAPVQDAAAPAVAPAGEDATEEEIAEACAFCGERHPRRYKCGEWAKRVGTTAESPWGGEGFARLPELPPVVIAPPQDRKAVDRRLMAAGQVLVLILAFVGVVTLLKLGFDATGGSSTTAAALPDCTPGRIQANINHLSTIQAEGTKPLLKRVDEINALQLKSGSGCDPQVQQLYSAFISYSALCLEVPKTDACGSANTTRTSLAQALAGQ